VFFIVKMMSVVLLLFTYASAEKIAVELASQDPEQTVAGNLILVLAEEKFEPSHPGLLQVYLSDIKVMARADEERAHASGEFRFVGQIRSPHFSRLPGKRSSLRVPD
jgi:hypothetical protein